MAVKTNILICLICIVIGFILYPVIRPCKENEIIHTDTLYVERVTRDTVYQDIPVPVTITEVRYDTTFIPADVDTAAILADYYSVREYSDTLLDNSDIYVHLSEKVSRNALFDRVLVYESRCRDQIITNTISPAGWYYTGGLGASKDSFVLSGQILYLNDKNVLKGLEIGYNTIPYFQLKWGRKF